LKNRGRDLALAVNARTLETTALITRPSKYITARYSNRFCFSMIQKEYLSMLPVRSTSATHTRNAVDAEFEP